MKEMVDSIEKLFDEVETVNGLWYFVDKVRLMVVVKFQSLQK